jgi:hypothetical protein
MPAADTVEAHIEDHVLTFLVEMSADHVELPRTPFRLLHDLATAFDELETLARAYGPPPSIGKPSHASEASRQGRDRFG